MLEQLHNGMPQRAYTEFKNKHITRPEPTFVKSPDPIYQESNKDVPQHFQVEFRDRDGDPWYIDQAERFIRLLIVIISAIAGYLAMLWLLGLRLVHLKG